MYALVRIGSPSTSYAESVIPTGKPNCFMGMRFIRELPSIGAVAAVLSVSFYGGRDPLESLPDGIPFILTFGWEAPPS